MWMPFWMRLGMHVPLWTAEAILPETRSALNQLREEDSEQDPMAMRLDNTPAQHKKAA